MIYRRSVVLIGVQARSTSERLPGKSLVEIMGRPMTSHVLDACQEAEEFINRGKHETGVEVKTVLLVPFGDQLAEAYEGQVSIMQGPEDDVLARYQLAFDKICPDYIVRVTGDCPMLPSFVITKHIRTATSNGLDYVSNVDPRYRTAPDGYDCEVISKRLFRWVLDNATSQKDREHVTTIIRREPPEFAQIAHILGHIDLSSLKFSVDTPDDLDRVKQNMSDVSVKLSSANQNRGVRIFRL